MMSSTIPTQRVKWLRCARQEAWDAFQKLPPPLKTVETWRRVDFGAWRLDQLSLDQLPEAWPLSAPGSSIDSNILQTDYSHSRTSLDPALMKQGIVLASLEEAAALFPHLVEAHLKSLTAPTEYRRLEAANLSCFRGGAFLHVPQGVVVDKPIEIRFTEPEGADFWFPRTLVIAEPGSAVTIVESHLSPERGWTNGRSVDPKAQVSVPISKLSCVGFSRLVAGRDCQVRYFYDQSAGETTTHFWHHEVHLEAGAQLRHYSSILGGLLHKSEVDIKLNGQGSRSALYGLLFGHGRQQFDARTAQRHAAPHSSSDLLFRTVLTERARTLYTGLIRIEGPARGCDAFQQNDNLLLSNNARADSSPILEILTDEVRCKHGATVGPVSAEELFYLGSRGLDPLEATRMLVLAFLDPILNQFPLERLRQRLREKIQGGLGTRYATAAEWECPEPNQREVINPTRERP